MANNVDVDILRHEKLEKYKFVRSIGNYHDVQLLLGNAEMGATARQDGLGFDRLWFSDFWRTASARMPIYGPLFEIFSNDSISQYSQVLNLEDGVLTTSLKKGNIGYKSEIFFSESDKDLLVIRLSELPSNLDGRLKLHLPVCDIASNKGGRWNVVKSEDERLFVIKEYSKQCILGTSIDEVMCDPKQMFLVSESYPVLNKMVYGVWCSSPLTQTDQYGTYLVETQGRTEILLVFTESTNWKGGNLVDNVLNQLHGKENYGLLYRSNADARKNNWEKMGVIDIPDKRHEQLWYRSIYWLFSTSASERFLPGECQFGCEGWNMIPFTYGGGGWGIHDFTMLGYPEKALQMLKQHDKPEAQNRNALFWLKYADEERKKAGMTEQPPYKQDINSPVARCFAHEIQTSGDGTLLTWGNQGHLQGFALELFQRYYNYYPSDEFLVRYLYPVAKGIAEFWANFLIWNHLEEEYYTPKTWGSSEGGMHNNPLDAVLAVKKCMKAAVKYANLLKVDNNLVEKWEFIEKNIHLPMNDKGYVAYKGHDGRIPENSIGYNGVRFINAFNFVNQEIIDNFDRKNIIDLLARTAMSNQFGKGFAVFHSAQTATAECMFGRGNAALGYMDGVLRALDVSGTCLRECEDRTMIYFLTNSDAYILVPIFMMLQSINGKLHLFPSIPDAWKNVSFYNMPIDNHIKVSAELRDGKIRNVIFTRDGQILKTTSGKNFFNISNM